ncbi:hypothetical protein WDU99_00550 [Microbacterium sp. Mu-80]|uniref:Uncharacterized protein n=1 Tax=Microbacterium bandirmense TaxID=3122050 RepID=A0ABU8L669_9MICO
MSFDDANTFPGDETRDRARAARRDEERLDWLSAPPPSHVAPASPPAAVPDDGASPDEGPTADDVVLYEDQVQPETGILGFTLRELVLVGAWLIAFVVSFFPVGIAGGSIWTNGIGWILTIGLPTAAVFLVVLRRLSPEGIRRVGSLGIDQFASVAAAVSAVAWAQLLWAQVAVTIATGIYAVGWVVIVAQLATLALVAATVAAPLIPRLRDDFEGRMETLAHRNANPVRPVIARPRRPRASAVLDGAGTTASDQPTPTDGAVIAEFSADAVAGEAGAGDAVAHDVVADDAGARVTDPADTDETIVPAPHEDTTADVPEKNHYTDPVGVLQTIFADGDDATAQVPVVADADGAQPQQTATGEPFWALAMTERDVFDEQGQVLFRIGPQAWTLVIEDRGGAYVVRHEDGRIGYLHDISDITKG